MERNRDLLYKVGDVVYVTAKDYEDGGYESGIILITDISDPIVEAINGMYGTKRLSGDIYWISVNCDELDRNCWTELLGNIHEDKALMILYGPK
jgi:hypothetical protein